MATRRCLIGAATIAFFLLAITIPAVSQMNHTVGGAAGWNFDLSSNATSANYPAWAASQTFHEHDFLIFNINTSSSFVMTANETAYNLCDDSYDRSYPIFWYVFMTPYVVSFTMYGYADKYTYFFVMDSQECLNGMKFGIYVLPGSSRKSGVERMQGGMVWIGLVLLSLGLMTV